MAEYFVCTREELESLAAAAVVDGVELERTGVDCQIADSHLAICFSRRVLNNITDDSASYWIAKPVEIEDE